MHWMEEAEAKSKWCPMTHTPHQHVNEFTFRLNDGNVKRQTLDRLNSMIAATVGRHITYQELIA